MRQISQKDRISIMVIDDHEMIVNGLCNLLEATPDFWIAGTAFNGKDAVEMVNKTKPDFVLMDIQMPKMDGITATRKIRKNKRNKNIKIIILTALETDDGFNQAIECGANGYMVKSSSAKNIINTIHSIHSGINSFQQSNSHLSILKELSPVTVSLFSQLTEKEDSVLSLVLQGHDIHQIAKLLDRDERTIRTHKEHIRKKLGVTNDVQLVLLTSRLGLTSKHNL